MTLPAAPTKEGYTFGGWYTDSACATPFKGNAFPDVEPPFMLSGTKPAPTIKDLKVKI